MTTSDRRTGARPGTGAAPPPARRGERGLLAVLVAFGVVAVVGYAVFGRNPARAVGLTGWGATFYSRSFGFFAQAHVLLAAATLAVYLARRGGWRWLGAFGAVYGVSLGSELLGTAYGVPFGPYAYTDLLGAKWLGLVPWLIPLSWFFMAVPSYGLADGALRRRGRRASAGAGSEVELEWSRGGWKGAGSRILLGSLLLLSWDLVLDPAMSEVTRYWVWGERGPYYGMPWLNLVGWYVTGLALMGVLEGVGARRWLRRATPAWLAGFYGANLVLPVGLAAVAGLWGAVVATAVVLGGVVVWSASSPRFRVAARRSDAEVVA